MFACIPKHTLEQFWTRPFYFTKAPVHLCPETDAQITQVFHNQSFKKETTTLILEYVGKMDAPTMVTQLLTGVPNLRPEFKPSDLRYAQKEFPNSMAWLSNKTPTTSPGATLLKTTAERTVIALAYLLCIFCDYAVEITYKGDDRAIVHELLDAPTPDLFDFFDRVHGMDIVERCDFRTDARRCHTFVFSGEAWFSKDFAQENFYQKPFTETLTFLQSQGYSLSTTPAKGQVVVYCDEQYPNHFGKIDEVDEQGNVIVLSKHGLGNIYRHRVENMIYQFGFQYYCLIPPQV